MEQKVLHYNRQAIFHLNKGDYLTSLEYLNKAKSKMRGSSLSICSKLMGITLNNLGCYYKSLNEPEKALVYLGQALEVEKANLNDLSNLAATHLNLCATESQLGNHLGALDNCLKVIHMLKGFHTSSPGLAQTFVTAHFNASAEYRKLGRLSESRTILEAGCRFSRELLGTTHFLTVKIEENLGELQSFSPRGKRDWNSPVRGRGSPGRSIRTSTAATSALKKLKSELDRSTDTYASTFSRISKRWGNAGLVKTFHGLSPPLRMSNTKTNKISLSKSRPKKLKSKKKVITRTEVAVQVDYQDPKTSAALKIQNAWRRFKSRKLQEAKNINQNIKKAELKVQSAYEELKHLQYLKSRIENREIIDLKEFKPIPFRSKYFTSN
jgi:tetratricopeptide (TPR) repeat protein